MVNILLSLWTFAEPYAKGELGKYIRQTDNVALISFAHKPTADQREYNEKYGYEGKHFVYPVLEFMKYGIERENIALVHYFDDSDSAMKQKIEQADILMFTGGMPDQVIPRLVEKNIYEDVVTFDKVIMGYSAGALLQMGRNFLSPDNDYPELTYMDGLSFIQNDFYIEVHYDHTDAWKSLLHGIRSEQQKSIYAIGDHGALVIDADRSMRTLGDVTLIDQ